MSPETEHRLLRVLQEETSEEREKERLSTLVVDLSSPRSRCRRPRLAASLPREYRANSS
jgi:hypothetical protein